MTSDQRATPTPADINRNRRPTSIATGGRHQSECPADFIGIRSHCLVAASLGRNIPFPGAAPLSPRRLRTLIGGRGWFLIPTLKGSSGDQF
jgi:hypothetical protein